MAQTFNMVWCEYWDESSHECGGLSRDLGRVTRETAQRRSFTAYHEAWRDRWGPGLVVFTDDQGRRVKLATATTITPPLLAVAYCERN